jgi:hypothetical protein
VKQKVGHAVVRHEDIRPPIVIVITDGHAQAVAEVLVQSGLRAHVRERALPVVAIEDVGDGWIDERVAVHANAPLGIPAEAIVRLRRIEIVGHEQVEVAVAVDVEERAARAPTREPDTGRASDIGEHTIAAVSVQDIRTVVGDVQVDSPIVVDIARARAHTVLLVPDAG